MGGFAPEQPHTHPLGMHVGTGDGERAPATPGAGRAVAQVVGPCMCSLTH